MTWTKTILLSIFSILLILNLNAQVISKKPLRSIIESLETKHNVSFTYADNAIAGIVLSFPDTMDLPSSIAYLNEHLELSFTQLDERFITVIPKELIIKKICGYLLDSETKEPVYASVYLEYDEAVEGIVNSDEKGYFELEIRESRRISIESLGYLSVEIKEFETSSCNTFYLKQKVVELEEVVISNYITQGINRINNGAFTINTEELGILPGLIEQDVLQTIQILPGIQSINERVADINARGGTNDQNLILWDGIRMYQSGHFFGLISAFNPYLTEKVHFIKNGTSAKYSNGISSTIDIRNSNDVSQKFSGGLGVNLINADLYMKLPISEKLSLQISARRSISDLFQTLTYQQYFDRVFANTEVTGVLNGDDSEEIETSNEEFFFRDLSVKLLFDPSKKDKVRINFLQIKNEISFQENAFINNTPETQTSSLDQDNISAGVSHSRLWSQKFRTNSFAYFTQYNLKGIDFDVINDQRLIQENEVLETGVELDADYSLSPKSSLKTGYQFYETGIGNLEELNNPEFRRYIKRVMRIHAIFSEFSYSSSSGSFSTTFGLRGNYYNKLDKYTIEPRLSLRQKLTQNFSIELLGEMKSQSSTQIVDLQNDFLGVEKRRWIMSDGDNIPLIENKQLSVGFNFQKNGLLISVENYIKNVNGITSRSQGFQNQFQFERSVGSYISTGVDALLNLKTDKLSTWITYSWAKNTYEFDEFNPEEFPSNLEVPHSVGIGANYSLNKFELSCGWKWRSGIPYTLPIAGNEVVNGDINYGQPNAVRLEDYSRIDVSLKYRLDLNDSKNLEFGVSVWNLLDKENILNQYYVINSEDQLEVIQQKSLGITPNLMIRFNFN